jgi:hypothetical protein
MAYHDEEVVLGPKQRLTPEGFLLCRDVPLARIGAQQYHALELPMDARSDGVQMIDVERPPSEVFDPSSVASFQGKPIVDDHPLDMIDPDNIHAHQIGTVINVRRGMPPDDDVLLGDMLFTSRRGIELVRNGKRAVSVGYDANYVRTGRGTARQSRIRANHVALVDEGRCGGRCMIGDAKPRRGKPVKTRAWDQSPTTEFNEFTSGPNWTQGGKQPGSPVGPSLIMMLPGPASAYHILDVPPGDRCALVASSGINGKLDPGNVAAGDRPLPTTRRPNSADAERRRMRDADAAWSRKTLAGINARNRAFWSSNGGQS